jgi:peptidoglycan hydrolase-like protein with peptidoglycan-binding domain
MRKILGMSALGLGLLVVSPAIYAQSSDEIQQAQQALKDKGFDPGAVDGIDGQQTKSATKQFQKAQNLNADGRLGPQTLDALGVKHGTAKTNLKAAGTNIKSSYSTGGKTIGQGGKELGTEVKDGHVVEGAKDFGKGVGAGAAKIGVGTGHAAKNAAKGVKNAVTGSSKTDTSK